MVKKVNHPITHEMSEAELDAVMGRALTEMKLDRAYVEDLIVKALEKEFAFDFVSSVLKHFREFGTISPAQEQGLLNVINAKPSFSPDYFDDDGEAQWYLNEGDLC